MAIIRWRPFSDIDKFFEDLNNFTKQVNQDFSTDIYEQNGNIIIEMNTAGINPDDIDITVEDDYVKVSGERKESHEEKNRQYFRKEIKKGTFERIIDLPTAVDVNNAKADFKDGILIITLPKSNKRESRKIKISKNNNKK